MASLGQLIAGVAHEINTPVASIKSNNGLLAKLIPQIDNTEIADIMKEINQIDNEAIMRISNMVTSLKKFVRLDEAELQEADINKEHADHTQQQTADSCHLHGTGQVKPFTQIGDLCSGNLRMVGLILVF